LDEGVLLGDLRVGPAPGAVELDDDGAAVLEAYLVDAVLVAVQREKAPVAAQPDRLERIEHAVGGEVRVGTGRHGGHCRRNRRCGADARCMTALPQGPSAAAARRPAGWLRASPA